MFHNYEGKLLECYYCVSPNLVKYGTTSGYIQRFRCKDCKKSFTVGGKRKKYNAFQKNNIVCRANEQGLRTISKIFHISPNTIKKRRASLVKEDTTPAFVDYNMPLQAHVMPN